jgi:hypothetical protein
MRLWLAGYSPQSLYAHLMQYKDSNKKDADYCKVIPRVFICRHEIVCRNFADILNLFVLILSLVITPPPFPSHSAPDQRRDNAGIIFYQASAARNASRRPKQI